MSLLPQNKLISEVECTREATVGVGDNMGSGALKVPARNLQENPWVNIPIPTGSRYLKYCTDRDINFSCEIP